MLAPTDKLISKASVSARGRTRGTTHILSSAHLCAFVDTGLSTCDACVALLTTKVRFASACRTCILPHIWSTEWTSDTRHAASRPVCSRLYAAAQKRHSSAVRWSVFR